MKSMTCKQLGGACDKSFSASTFDEIAKMSQEHGKEMFDQGDEAHLKAMSEMQQLMEKPEDMTAWFDKKRQEFNNLAEN